MSGKSRKPAASIAEGDDVGAEYLREFGGGRRPFRHGVLRPDGARQEHGGERENGRDAEEEERAAVAVRVGDDRGDDERPRDGADLVHGGMHAPAEAMADDVVRFRDEHVARRAAHRLAGALDDDERGGRLPGADERERGDGDDVDRVTRHRDLPVGARLVGEAPDQ
jgi:hypothetical protein